MNTHRPPQKRAFIGLVGRNIPGDVVVETLEPPQNGHGQPTDLIEPDSVELPKTRRGRPAKNATGAMSPAERKRQSRERIQNEKDLVTMIENVAAIKAQHHDWKGKLPGEASGGHGSDEIQDIAVKQDRREQRHESGGRVSAPGASPDPDHNYAIKEYDDTFVNKAFRRTYGLTREEAEDFSRQVMEEVALKTCYCTFQFQCQVCEDFLWSGERLDHFKEQHPHLIEEFLADHAAADENEILRHVNKFFVMLQAAFYCSFCEDEGRDEAEGYIEISEPETWDGDDYIEFLHLNRDDLIDHLYEKHYKRVYPEIQALLNRMDPEKWDRIQKRLWQRQCKVNHREYAISKAKEMMTDLQATDKSIRAAGNAWGAADNPWIFKCPNCSKQIKLRIS